MTQPPEETPDPLAKPPSPSGRHGEPTSPYVSQPRPDEPRTLPLPDAYGTPPPAPGPYLPYGPGPGMPGYPFSQAHTGANVAMGLGITSLVCALGTLACCVTIPGVLTGPFAIALAVRARKEMSQAPGAYNNEGAATTGLVTGIIGTVLGLAMVGLVLFLFGAFYSFGS